VTTEQMDATDDEPWDAITTRGPRIPSTLTGMSPVSAYNLGWQESRDAMTINTAFLITPHGEKIPIPRHVAAQIRSIEYLGGQPVRVVTEDDDEAKRLKDIGALRDDYPTQAEEPIEDRLQRAFCNGFIEGIQRGSRGRFDHS